MSKCDKSSTRDHMWTRDQSILKESRKTGEIK